MRRDRACDEECVEFNFQVDLLLVATIARRPSARVSNAGHTRLSGFGACLRMSSLHYERVYYRVDLTETARRGKTKCAPLVRYCTSMVYLRVLQRSCIEPYCFIGAAVETTR